MQRWESMRLLEMWTNNSVEIQKFGLCKKIRAKTI